MATNLSIGIISTGCIGSALDNVLCAAGHMIVGIHAPSETSPGHLGTVLPGVPSLGAEEVTRQAEALLSTVSNDELSPLVEGLTKLDCSTAGQLTIHVTGRYGMSVLGPAARTGALALTIHSAITFTGASLDVAHLADYPFAVTAPAALLPIGQALVTEAGGISVVVAEKDRDLYHTILAHGTNHLVTLVAQLIRVLEAAGVEAPGIYLAPLLQAAPDGTLGSGESTPTGPVAHGDTGTVCGHPASLDALAATGGPVDVPPAYRALVRVATVRVAARSLREPPAIDRMLVELDGGTPGPAASD